MDLNQAIAKLIAYALKKQLIQPEEKNWAVNTLLELLDDPKAVRGILLHASRLYSRQERRKSQEGQQ